MIALFAIAYAIVTFGMGVLPLNMLLRKLMGASPMPAIWRNSMLQLAEQTAFAAVSCWIALAVSGRIRGRLTGRGMVALGAAMSGALAGALDVGAHKLWVTRLIQAAHAAPWRGHALSAAMTVGISLIVTLALITRSTTVVAEER